MDLAMFGDTHDLHREVEVPPAEILICCGDFSMFSYSLAAIQDFNAWLGELPHSTKLVIPGNHDHVLVSDRSSRSLISNATVLIDEEITIHGLKIYGSPMTPQPGGAFSMPSAEERVRHWERIPNDVSVLVTHGPPHGVLDRSPGQFVHMGDPELMARVKNLPSLRMHCFGHIHGAYGSLEKNGVLFINAALMGPLGEVDRAPALVRMNSFG